MSLSQPLLNHRGGGFVAAFLRAGTGDVGRYHYGEILLGRQPHHHIPHRIRTIVHQCVSARPVALDDNPTASIVAASRWSVKPIESVGLQQAILPTALHVKHGKPGKIVERTMDTATGGDGGRVVLLQWHGDEQFAGMTPGLVHRTGFPWWPEPGGVHV